MTLTVIAILCVIAVLINIVLNIVLARARETEKIKRVLIPFFNALLGIATIAIAALSVEIPKPAILPLDGMLTKEKPEVEIVYEHGPFWGEAYYSTDPYSIPSKSGTKYTDKFIPEISGTYYVQSTFLWRSSEIVSFPVITYADSLSKLGEQDSGSGNSVEAPVDQEKNISFGDTTVSQEQSFAYSNLPEGFQSGWGDNIGGRASYTIEEINEGKLYDQIIFNAISNSTIGDEKNFVGAMENRVTEPGEIRYVNANLIDVEIGKEYIIRIYGHNNSPWGYDKVAEDVEIQFQIPSESGRSIAVHGLISSSNATPSIYWDGVVLTCNTPFCLEYVKGSAFLENNGIGAGGFLLPDSVVNNWVTVGYDKIDGKIPGCYQYSFHATICVKVVEGAGN